MSDFPQKINNSYESGSSSSSACSMACSVNEQVLDKSMHFDDMDGHKLTHLLLPEPGHNDLCNSSVEEGIFPNVSNYAHNDVPSYQPSYDYTNEYSNTPLVYSWLPIVPGFIQDGFDNLYNFQHLGKFDSPPLNSYDDDGGESIGISNQNEKYREYLVINNPEPKMLNNQAGMNFHELENSCNAMDLNISCTEETASDPDLSFNGRIAELVAHHKSPEVETVDVTEIIEQIEIVSKNEEPLEAVELKDPEQTEEERLHNESFELLKKEDSSRMLYINEKSPDLFNSDGEVASDNEPQTREQVPVSTEVAKPSEDCDNAVLNKLRSSLAGLPPPTRHQLSLSEIISTYKKNLAMHPSPTATRVESSSLFLPSHTTKQVATMEWPQLLTVKCPTVFYNRSTACEDIEVLCLRYGERFITSETSSSFNLKTGPSSAKKRMEKLKLLTQSPGSRLSHLANRRKIFSSANLKSNSLNASQSSSFSGKLQIEKSKLYSKARPRSPKKRTSAKKKTPGKRKTPKSAKRQLITQPQTSRATSKRALFTSPLESQPVISVATAPKEVPIRGRLPRRTLFSPPSDENKKRRRSQSPDQDAENRGGKHRRLESPTRMPKSQSFSVAATSSTSTLDAHFRKKLFGRTQSEVMAPASSSRSVALGFRETLTKDIKNKILWAVSTALTTKKISKEHEKFKEYASILAKLVKTIFLEFYNPTIKSISGQLSKFANFMVFQVVQGLSHQKIYMSMKVHLESKNTTKVSGYIAQQDYERNQTNLIRRNNSLLLMSQSCSSLNFSHSESFIDIGSLNSSKLSESNSSLNRSSSKNNDSGALRENFLASSRENSAMKFGGSDSNLAKHKSTSSTNLLKAKRQISF